MTNFSLTPSCPLSAKQENHTVDNGTHDSSNSSLCDSIELELTVICTFIFVPCIFGLLGNGAVIWLLGFRLKRTPVTTYILNLAVSDFGVLVSVIPPAVSIILIQNCTMPVVIPVVVGMVLFHFMFSTSQFLLTVISIDRCMSVLFPIWYRCHRPERLSPILCAFVWAFCFLFHAVGNIELGTVYSGLELSLMFLLNAVVCFPLITISTMILFIRFCLKPQQHQRKKLLTAILFALFFFLFFAFPLNVMYIIVLRAPDHNFPIKVKTISVGYLCASLNSCVNPLIYFLVGRKKTSLQTMNLRLILQRVFKQEEEVYGEELQFSVQTQVSA